MTETTAGYAFAALIAEAEALAAGLPMVERYRASTPADSVATFGAHQHPVKWS